MNIRLTPQAIAAAKAMRATGMTQRQIAAQLAVGRTSVRRALAVTPPKAVTTAILKHIERGER